MTDSFTVTLDDVTPMQVAMLMGAVGQIVPPLVQAGRLDHLEALLEFQSMLIVEHPELARAALLDTEPAKYLRAAAFPEELCEELDLEVRNGQFLDARSLTDIEVTGGDDE